MKRIEILQELKELYKTNIKNNYFNIKNRTHCGSEGHFIEKLLNIKVNCKNEPDYKGFEIKKRSDKISFGDWVSTGYLFNQDKFMKKFNNIKINIDRDDFMKFFGNYNIKKERYSWSGKCIPKYDKWNYNGTILTTDDLNNLYIIYSNTKDKRNIYLPELFKKEKYIILQYWDHKYLKKKVENKFNNLGFIIFDKDENGYYNKMLIGERINYNFFINCIKNGSIFFDSGMYQGNKRKYSQFRARFNLWDKLIIEEYS